MSTVRYEVLYCLRDSPGTERVRGYPVDKEEADQDAAMLLARPDVASVRIRDTWEDIVTGPTNVFEGAPDGRQMAEVDAPVSRFRPTYRALTPEQKALHDALKAKAAELEALIEQVPLGDYRHDAMRSLELAVIWAVKDLTA